MNQIIEQSIQQRVNKSNLPRKSFKTFASKYGLDVENDNISEAESIWAMLDDLRHSDPNEYQKFIHDQMFKKDEIMNSRRPFFTPMKNFVVKTKLKSPYKEHKLFVNFCQHDAIGCPRDNAGCFVEDNASEVPQDLEVPLVVSEMRRMENENSNDSPSSIFVVDIVFHPWCLAKARNHSFRSNVIKMGLKSVEKDCNVLIVNEWKLIRSEYKDGIGQNKRDARPFFVDEKSTTSSMDTRADKPQESNVLGIMETPESLLRSLNTPALPPTLPKDSPLKKKPLIQEICTKNKKQNIKSGFLLNTKMKKSLYETKSSGDGTTGTGGAYANFLSKCQVVDMSTLGSSSTEGGFLEKSTTRPSSMADDSADIFLQNIKKGFLNKKKKMKKTTNTKFDEEFRSALESFDPIFADTLEDDNAPGSDDVAKENEINETLSNLATIISDHASQTKTSNVDMTTPLTKSASSKELPYDILEKRNKIIINVDLSSCVSGTKKDEWSVNDVDLQISQTAIKLITPCQKFLNIELSPLKIDDTKAKARWKRGRMVLSITAPNVV